MHPSHQAVCKRSSTAPDAEEPGSAEARGALEFSLGRGQCCRMAAVRKIHATRLLPPRRPMRVICSGQRAERDPLRHRNSPQAAPDAEEPGSAEARGALEFSLGRGQCCRMAAVRKIHATRLLPPRRPMRVICSGQRAGQAGRQHRTRRSEQDWNSLRGWLARPGPEPAAMVVVRSVSAGGRVAAQAVRHSDSRLRPRPALPVALPPLRARPPRDR